MLFVNSVTYGCHAVCLYLLSDHKRGKAFSVAGSVVLWLLCMGLCAFATSHQNSSFYWFITNIDILLMLALFALTTSGSFARSVFMVFTYGIYFYFTMIPCELTLRFLPHPWRFVPYAPIRLLMYVLLIMYWMRRGRNMFERATGHIEKPRWIMLGAFSVIALFSVTFVMTRLLMLNANEGFWEYAISVSMLLVTASAYVLIIRIMAVLNDENENRMIREREKLLLSELNAQKAFVEQARQNRHDLRHHTAMLRDLLRQNDREALGIYLGEYERTLGEQGLDSYCENTVVNALLRTLHSRATQNGFSFDCEAQIPEQLPLSATSVCVLFGNLFENAYEATCACGSGRIYIRARNTDGSLYLEVQNPVAGKVIFKEGIPVTTKHDGGFGSKSIVSALQQCGGMVTFAQKKSTFVARVIIPL